MASFQERCDWLFRLSGPPRSHFSAVRPHVSPIDMIRISVHADQSSAHLLRNLKEKVYLGSLPEESKDIR